MAWEPAPGAGDRVVWSVAVTGGWLGIAGSTVGVLEGLLGTAGSTVGVLEGLLGTAGLTVGRLGTAGLTDPPPRGGSVEGTAG